MKSEAAFNIYFQDEYPDVKGPCREYFFNILNTIHPEYLKEVLTHASRQRMTTDGETMKKESIKISEFWAEQLHKMPYLSCKCSQVPKSYIHLMLF